MTRLQPQRPAPARFLAIGSPHQGARLIALWLVLVGMSSPVWAGAWTVPKNRWYAEYFYRYFGSKKLFDSEGDSNRRPKAGLSEDIRNEWKLEYGVTDSFNVLASLPYISAHYRDDGIDLLRTGVGDIYVRTKFRMLQDPIVSSMQFSWKIPGAYDPKKNPIGDGQFDFESRLLLSKSWTFWPYQAVVSSSSAPRPSARPRLASRPHGPATREAALRDAVVTAELYQRGVRLSEAGRDVEAAKYFRAVLASDPTHEAAKQWLFQDAMAASDERTRTPRGARSVPVRADVMEPIYGTPPKPRETQTRYAGVAFVNLEGGFTARAEEPANEFPIYLEAGITPWKRLMVVGTLESTLSVKSTHEDTEDWAKWGVRGIFNLWGDGFATIFRESRRPTVNLEVGYNDVFAGRNTADAFEIFGKVGVSF